MHTSSSFVENYCKTSPTPHSLKTSFFTQWPLQQYIACTRMTLHSLVVVVVWWKCGLEDADSRQEIHSESWQFLWTGSHTKLTIEQKCCWLGRKWRRMCINHIPPSMISRILDLSTSSILCSAIALLSWSVKEIHKHCILYRSNIKLRPATVAHCEQIGCIQQRHWNVIWQVAITERE